MTTYIPLENALWMLETAYLGSVTLLLAISYLGWVAITKIEQAGDY